jgi:hypothetical protein
MIGAMSGAIDHWWAFALRGVAAVIFGFLAFAWPGVTLAVLVLLWGAYALVDGILALASAFRTGQGSSMGVVDRGYRWHWCRYRHVRLAWPDRAGAGVDHCSLGADHRSVGDCGGVSPAKSHSQ